jgi:hypothetical protein
MSDFGHCILSCGRLVMQHNYGPCKYGAMRPTWPVTCSKLRPTDHAAQSCPQSMSIMLAAVTSQKHCNATVTHSPSRFQSTSPRQSEAACERSECVHVYKCVSDVVWCIGVCTRKRCASTQTPTDPACCCRSCTLGTLRSECRYLRRTPPDTH